MDVEQISALYTISFSHPRLHPNSHGDFCIYFALETKGTGTLVTDLALFIRNIGQKLIKWSVLGHPDCLGPGDPIHPTLQDLAYCWDGVATAYGVLQFSAQAVAAMNIRRVFHRTASVCAPFCHIHRYEYFATGIFLDVDRTTLLSMFNEMESAAQYVHSTQFHLILELLMHGCMPGSCVMTMTFSLMPRIIPNVFHSEP